MPWESWFWFIFTVVASLECVRQFWLLMRELAIPDEWPSITSEHSAPTEGDHVADQDRL